MRIRRWFIKEKYMNKINITTEALNDEALRAARDQVLVAKYTKIVNQEPNVARSIIIERVAAETGLTSKTVRQVLKSSGCETAMGNYRNSGLRSN